MLAEVVDVQIPTTDPIQSGTGTHPRSSWKTCGSDLKSKEEQSILGEAFSKVLISRKLKMFRQQLGLSKSTL